MNDPVKLRAEQPRDAISDLALLRAPFLPHQISKLPKPYKKDSPKGKCPECGGYHGLPAVHLDYVGHAALTDRLLDVDPEWSWEPVADPTSHGLPVAPGSMWIKLTVCGVSRYGFGHPDGKSGGDAVKETIGDALRNAAMRFGAALDLWHKGDLHVPDAKDDALATSDPIVERKRAAQAKRDGDDTRFKEAIDVLDLDGVAGWFENFDELTAHLPLSWLDSVRDRLELRREELMENIAALEAADEMDEAFRASVGPGESRMAGRGGERTEMDA